MSQIVALSRRELYGLLTQRWILILVALLGLELLIGVGVRINYYHTFDLGNVVVTMAFLGSMAMMGLSLDAVTKERSSGALDVILTRPVGRRRVMAGKLLAYLIVSVPVGLLGVFLPMGAASLLGVTPVFDRFPLHLVLPGTLLMLAFYSVLGVAISLFCRTLQSAFALGGAVWVFFSPLVWEFLVLRGLQRHLDGTTLAQLNLFNPVGAYFSTVWQVDSFGPSEFMTLGAPTWIAYGVLILDLVLVALFALLLFDRQEEPGYRE